jgi:hypothetical protein
MIEPTKEQLIEFVEQEGLNLFECFNEDRTDIIQEEMNAGTFVEQNYNMVLSLYLTKDCEL